MYADSARWFKIGTDEIGYEVVGNEVVLYARGLVEIIMPGEFRKRYYVSCPIVR